MGNALGPRTNKPFLHSIAMVWSVNFVNKKTAAVAKAEFGQILSLGLVYLVEAGRARL